MTQTAAIIASQNRPLPWITSQSCAFQPRKRAASATPFKTRAGTFYSAAAMTSPKRWMPSRMVSASAFVKFRRMVG